MSFLDEHSAPRMIEAFGQWEPRAVVFDCDGVLLDTQAAWDRAQMELMRDRGRVLDEQRRHTLVGRTITEVVGAIAQFVGEDAHEVGAELGRRYRDILSTGLPVLEGARELVEAVAGKVPLAVASNTPRPYLLQHLRTAGLLDYMDFVVAEDDVAEGKPAPDIYARACALLGVAPGDALAIEDSETGARSANDAGMKVLAAPIIAGQKPDAVVSVDAIGDPQLRAWVQSWSAQRTRDAQPHRLGSLQHFYPRAVVFDCDGLLLDTESLWEGVQHRIVERAGVTLTPQQEQALMGTTLEQAVEILAEVTRQDYDALLESTRIEFAEAIAGQMRFMPGAKEFVELVASKVPIAVASNSWHSALEDKLTRAGIIHLFHNLQSADTVEHGKPAPDMYAQAVDALGFEPQQCLAFEDSALGGRAARAAGLALVAVPSSANPVEDAHVSVASLADPELIAWVKAWPTRTHQG